MQTTATANVSSSGGFDEASCENAPCLLPSVPARIPMAAAAEGRTGFADNSRQAAWQ